MRGIVKTTKLLLALAAVALVAVVPGAHADEGFVAGPSGGDGQNTKIVDPPSGRVTVVRHNPVPGAFNCGGSGGYAYLRAARQANGADEVVVRFTDAVVDSYTWITVQVLDGSGRWLGSGISRGPLASVDGTMTVPLDEAVSGSVMVNVGLQVASACPNVDGGTVRFTSVTTR